MDNDLGEQIDQLAIKIEEQIAETEAFLDNLPDFAPRSARSEKVHDVLNS